MSYSHHMGLASNSSRGLVESYPLMKIEWTTSIWSYQYAIYVSFIEWMECIILVDYQFSHPGKKMHNVKVCFKLSVRP